MIRPAKEPLRRKPYCRRIRPRFFWRQCEQCGNEFRGEDLWVKKLMGLGMGGRNCEYTTYICTHCAPTIEIAETLFCSYHGGFERSQNESSGKLALSRKCRVPSIHEEDQRAPP